MNTIQGDPYLAPGVELQDLTPRDVCPDHDRPFNAYGQCKDCVEETMLDTIRDDE